MSNFFQAGDTAEWRLRALPEGVKWDCKDGPGWMVKRIFVHDEIVFQRIPSKETVEEKRWNDPEYRAAYCGVSTVKKP